MKSCLDVVDEASAESRVSVAELVLQGFRRALLNQTDRVGVWVCCEEGEQKRKCLQQTCWESQACSAYFHLVLLTQTWRLDCFCIHCTDCTETLLLPMISLQSLSAFLSSLHLWDAEIHPFFCVLKSLAPPWANLSVIVSLL